MATASPTSPADSAAGRDFALKYGTFMRILRAGTGLSFATVWTWVASEGGPSDNPLNIGPGKHYGSPAKAAIATIALLRSPQGVGYGYAAILAAGKTSGNVYKKEALELKAISMSKWEATHYDNGAKLAGPYKTWFPSRFQKGSSFWNWVGQTVTDPGQSIKDAGSWYQGALGGILSAQLWIRVLMVIIGAIALIGALVLFTKELSRVKVIPT